MGDPALTPGARFTYGQYKTWPDEERWELIEGKAWAMSPAPLVRHQELLGRLHLTIGNFLAGKPCRVFLAPFDVRLPRSDEPDDEVDTVVQPDIVVFCDGRKLDRRGARGAPDWAIEILSARTAKKDYETKHLLYQKHGVREYWIVDPAAAAVHVWRLGDDGRYGEEELYEAEGSLASSVVSGLSIDLAALFADLA